MSNFTLRVLHIASWYPSRLHPTLGNFVQRHIEAISTRCHSQVLAVYSERGRWTVSLEQHKENGIEVIRAFHSRKNKLFQRKKAFELALRSLLVDGDLPFDLVHLHVTFPHGWMARSIKQKFDIPYVITEHWTGYHSGRKLGWVQRKHDKKVAEESAAILPVTHHLAQAMRAKGLEGNYDVVPNVVDTSLFQIVAKPPEPFRFIHVSHLLDDHKNVSGILRVFARVLTKKPNTHLHIVGDGEIDPYIKLAERLQIPTNNLLIEGEQTLPEIAQRINQSHSLVLFSNYENLPCVIVEALAAGVPVVSTNVGGIKEHISPDLGLLLQAGDETALETAMLKIMEQYSSFKPEFLRNYAQQNFSIDAVAKSYEATYHKALES